jgi:hypothetical protein
MVAIDRAQTPVFCLQFHLQELVPLPTVPPGFLAVEGEGTDGVEAFPDQGHALQVVEAERFDLLRAQQGCDADLPAVVLQAEVRDRVVAGVLLGEIVEVVADDDDFAMAVGPDGARRLDLDGLSLS